MPREGAIIFRDLNKCGRRGRYCFHRLIERDGIDAKFD